MKNFIPIDNTNKPETQMEEIFVNTQSTENFENINKEKAETKLNQNKETQKLKENLLKKDNENNFSESEILKSTNDNETTENKWRLIFKKNFEKDWFPKFRKWLDDMLQAWIISQAEKDQIIQDLKDPEVRESIKTRMSVRWVSTGYTLINFFTATPLAAILWPTARAWLIVFVIMYILKRFIINWVVQVTGKWLEKKWYISNMSMVPIIWEHATLIELYKKHPTAAKYFFAFRRTLKKQKKFNKETNLEIKNKNLEKRKNWVEKEIKWLETQSNRWIKLNSSIDKQAVKTKVWFLNLFWINKN